MALDIGEVRVGIAISDPGERVASPITVLPSAEVKAFRIARASPLSSRMSV